MQITSSPLPEILPAFRWNPAMQRRFVEVVAATGSVRLAAAAVSKTHRSAYQLRGRAEGHWFGVCWDAAVLVVRNRVADDLIEAAMQPVEYIGTRNPATRRLSWRRANPALGRGRSIALLTRLDKAAEKIAADAVRHRLAMRASGDFAAALALLARAAGTREWRGFFAAADERENDILCGYLRAFPPFFMPDGRSTGHANAAEFG